jgi:hypothetical protein
VANSFRAFEHPLGSFTPFILGGRNHVAGSYRVAVNFVALRTVVIWAFLNVGGNPLIELELFFLAAQIPVRNRIEPEWFAGFEHPAVQSCSI